jgi:hypothetical protein
VRRICTSPEARMKVGVEIVLLPVPPGCCCVCVRAVLAAPCMLGHMRVRIVHAGLRPGPPCDSG